MLVYGDQSRTVEVRAELTRLQAAWAALTVPLPNSELSSGVDRHGRFCAVFTALSELLQGVGDDAPEAEPAFLQLNLAAAGALRRSWDSGFAELPPVPADLFAEAVAVAPDQVVVKVAEGYAFYGLYPEAYREAARELPPGARVIGIRSIGAGLACIVADAVGAEPPLTVRPSGHPFQRTVSLPPLDSAAAYAVADEGPGLSGSSFGAVADALEAQGVAPERVVFMPSHPGDLGSQASEARRARWRCARRPHVSFDALIAPRLPSWVEDLTGPAHEVEDLSGGAWRQLTHGPDQAMWPPSAAHQERRKFLLRSSEGEFLLKFVGLGEIGLRAAERARQLHAAGFTPEPLGWRHGFLVERWTESRPLAPGDRPALLEILARYLHFRAEAFAAEETGASTQALAEMVRVNVAEALGPELAQAVPRPPSESSPRVAVDGRLHAWEWRVTGDGGIVKTDAVDHALAHDLIGPQPLAWDVSGAVVEHDLSAEEAARLGDLHPFWPVAYAAFQLGLWKMAADALSNWPEEQVRCSERSAVYARVLARRLST